LCILGLCAQTAHKSSGEGAMARSHCPMNEPLRATGGSIPLIASPESPTSRLPSRPLSFDKANPGPAQAICSCPCPCPDELLSAPAQRRRCFMAQAHLGAIAPKHASMRLLCPMASSLGLGGCKQFCFAEAAIQLLVTCLACKSQQCRLDNPSSSGVASEVRASAGLSSSTEKPDWLGPQPQSPAVR
jgi:hypothetical protein